MTPISQVLFLCSGNYGSICFLRWAERTEYWHIDDLDCRGAGRGPGRFGKPSQGISETVGVLTQKHQKSHEPNRNSPFPSCRGLQLLPGGVFRLRTRDR